MHAGNREMPIMLCTALAMGMPFVEHTLTLWIKRLNKLNCKCSRQQATQTM